MRLDYVVLLVEDLDRSIRFYVEVLGFELGHRSGPYAQFVTGETRLGVYEREAMAGVLGQTVLEPPDANRPAFEIGCKVDDCDAAYGRVVRLGAEAWVEPTDRPWGQRTAYVRDPDGHLVELAQDGVGAEAPAS